VSVANTLRSISETDGCVLAMIRPRRSSLSRFWWGSVTDDLIGRLTVPLLIIPEAASEDSPVRTVPDDSFKKMLVYLDGTEASSAVLESAAAMASTGAECHLLRVLPLASAHAKWRGGPNRLSDLRAEAWRKLFEARERLEQEGIASKPQVVVDGIAAGAAIVEQATASEVQLIVLAARMHLLPWWLREGVAEYVVRHASVPVLIVPFDGNLTLKQRTNHVDFRFN
jgi:nucleotide-binding universal stress UspA family protein